MIETGKYEDGSFRLSCSLYELLEIWSMRQTPVEVSYADETGKQQEFQGIITNIYSRDGVEWVELGNKLLVPTKQLIQVNDVSFRNYMQ